MVSGHGDLVRRNRAAEYYRSVNLALLPLRKAPERICTIHHQASITHSTRLK